MSNPYPPYPESDYPPDDDVEEVDAVEADYPQFLDSPLKEKPEYQESDDTEAEDEVEESPNRVIYRGSTNDPAFGFLLALAMCIGLIPLINNGNADLRYTIAWGVLAGVGVLSWLLGSLERIEQEVPENLGWGIGFGILVGAPFLLFGGSILQTAVRDIFPDYSAGTVLAYLVFVMPLAETLFFRGLLQRNLDFWVVGILGAVWNLLLFFPVMWAKVLEFPSVAIVIAVALVMMNVLYAYVRDRNSLASAWLTQISVNIIMVFIPFL